MTIDLDYLDYLRDHLLDKENTLYLADCAIERKYEKQPSDEVSQTLRSLAQINLRSNIDIIYENAGSPIEKIFLNAVNLSGFMISQFFLDWTPPFYSASRHVEWFRQKAEQIEYLYAEYVNATGQENQKEFVDSAEQSGDFSNEEMKFIKTHMRACLTNLVHSRASIFIFRSPLVLRMSLTYFRANPEMARRNRSIRRSEKPARELCETSS